MGADFSRTVRSLKTGGPSRRVTGMICAVAILGAWTCWFLQVPVAVYEATEAARLEVASIVRPVVSLVEGQVIQILAEQADTSRLVPARPGAEEETYWNSRGLSSQARCQRARAWVRPARVATSTPNRLPEGCRRINPASAARATRPARCSRSSSRAGTASPRSRPRA